VGQELSAGRSSTGGEQQQQAQGQQLGQQEVEALRKVRALAGCRVRFWQMQVLSGAAILHLAICNA
jgi:hypothetical protein